MNDLIQTDNMQTDFINLVYKFHTTTINSYRKPHLNHCNYLVMFKNVTLQLYVTVIVMLQLHYWNEPFDNTPLETTHINLSLNISIRRDV